MVALYAVALCAGVLACGALAQGPHRARECVYVGREGPDLEAGGTGQLHLALCQAGLCPLQQQDLGMEVGAWVGGWVGGDGVGLGMMSSCEGRQGFLLDSQQVLCLAKGPGKSSGGRVSRGFRPLSWRHPAVPNTEFDHSDAEIRPLRWHWPLP